MIKFLIKLFTRKPALSNPVVTTEIVNVLSREQYNKVRDLCGTTAVQRDDTEHTVAYKLGIQHCLRVLEKECVVNG